MLSIEKKIFFFVSQVLSFRLKKQTSENVADTAFKYSCLFEIKRQITAPTFLVAYFVN